MKNGPTHIGIIAYHVRDAVASFERMYGQLALILVLKSIGRGEENCDELQYEDCHDFLRQLVEKNIISLQDDRPSARNRIIERILAGIAIDDEGSLCINP